jgi:putative transposase
MPSRSPHRLPDRRYDAGAFFITVVTAGRIHWFGNVVNGAVIHNELGNAVREEWLNSSSIRPGTSLDAFVLMPNHLHALVWLQNGADHSPPLDRAGRRLVSHTVGALLRGFKGAATRRVNLLRNAPGGRLWQANYFEHVVRSEGDLTRIRRYIRANPDTWVHDPLNVEAVPDEWERSFWKNAGP